MSDAVASAISGMRAAALRLEVSARNVASAAPGTTRISADADRSGGLPGSADGRPGGPPRLRANAPVWMATAGTEPGVDLAAEALEQATASADFMANARALAITQDMAKRLFELTDRS